MEGKAGYRGKTKGVGVKNQLGMSTLKLIIIIALGILMAGFIGCVGRALVIGALIKGVHDQLETMLPKFDPYYPKQSPIIIKPPGQNTIEQRLNNDISKVMDNFGQAMIRNSEEATKRANLKNGVTSNGSTGTVKMNGKTCIYRREGNGWQKMDCS